jgi:hypothetical protein
MGRSLVDLLRLLHVLCGSRCLQRMNKLQVAIKSVLRLASGAAVAALKWRLRRLAGGVGQLDNGGRAALVVVAARAPMLAPCGIDADLNDIGALARILEKRVGALLVALVAR